jgi:hypothetical protein
MNKLIVAFLLLVSFQISPLVHAQGSVSPKCPDDKVRMITSVSLSVNFTAPVSSFEEGAKTFKGNIEKLQSLANEHDKKYEVQVREYNYSISPSHETYFPNALPFNNKTIQYLLTGFVGFSLNNEDIAIKMASKLEQMGLTPNLSLSFSEAQCFETYEEVQGIK